VEDLAGADDQAVVLLRGEKVASAWIRETLVHFAVKLDGRAEIARLEGRLVEIEQRLDEEGVIGRESRNLRDAVLLAVEEIAGDPAIREDPVGGPARRLFVPGRVEKPPRERERGDRERGPIGQELLVGHRRDAARPRLVHLPPRLRERLL